MDIRLIKITILALMIASPVFAADKKGAAKVKTPTPEMIAKGKTIFTMNCVPCHGEKGDGMGPAGAVMNPHPRNFNTEAFKAGEKPEQVFNTVSKGLPGTAMAPFGHLPEVDRWNVVYYVLDTFRKKK